MELYAAPINNDAIMTYNYIPVNPYSLPVQKYIFFIILGGYGHTGKWIQENIIYMRFCCCFKLSKKLKNCQTSSQHMHRQMHTDWPSTVG